MMTYFSFTTTFIVVSMIILETVALESGAQLKESAESKALPQIRARGIVVPKRSSIISGLNQQFKLKSKPAQLAAASNQQPVQQLPQLNVTISLQQPANVIEEPLNNNKPASLLNPISWLAPLSPVAKRQKEQKEQQQKEQQQAIQQQTHQNLYLDRYQQQLLAANPSLLNPPTGSNLSLALLTRSDLDSLSGLQGLNGSQTFGLRQANQQQQQQQQDGQQQQQQYRGFSLIELDVKSESDRRYIQDLYGNLSAAINEQAQNPQSLTVSPYVDVDFWSYKYAINDRIDIMVSPKSRAFILNQLARAKIRHRIKIDDIQARLDQQQQPSVGGAATGSSAQLLPNQQQLSQMMIPMGKSADSPLSGRQVGSNGRSTESTSNFNGRQAEVSQPIAAGAGGPMNDSVFFENYQRLADITQYIESIVERNRDIARVKVIGRSSQGRYLRVLKLGYDQSDSDASSFGGGAGTGSGGYSGAWRSDSGEAGRQPAAIDNAQHILDTFFTKQASTKKLGSIWMDGGTHAREWISPATALYIAHRLSDNHQKCQNFFEGMRQIVATNAVLLEQQQQQRFNNNYNQLNNNQQARQARSSGVGTAAAAASAHLYLVEPQPAVKPAPIPAPTHLDPVLIPSINEINTSLLGKPVEPIRQRTELEKSMEMLAKNPQVLANDYKCDLELDQLLRRYTFYVMPVLNPDGYEYSHTHNRLWRKTRSTSSHPIYRHFCLGADPNRNYDARHGSTGSSSHPCSQTYAGTVPFTEPETRHQSNFVYANRLSLKMFISFHSYSQMILLPFSHSKQLAPDHKDLESVGQAAVKAIERTHGTVYRVGPSASILYTASGTASDWAYEKAGIKYSYTIELRDQGTYGFLLPKQQIVPTGEETFNGLLAMIDQMEKNDNLLTSKSASSSSSAAAAASPSADNLKNKNNSSSNSTNNRIPDYNHVPDPEQMKSQFGGPNHIGPIRPPLENILDGSDTWAAPDNGPTGVRDRRPLTKPFTSLDSNFNAETREPVGSKLSDDEPKPVASAAAGELGEEHVGNDSEPDAGYAFEGEGELMEPTRENLVESARLSHELRVSGRRDHSRRISQATGLTSTGRNYINSPLLTSRMTTSSPKRESSEQLINSP